MNALAYAARQPLAIVVLIVAIIGGLSVALWLLPLGFVAYAAMVFLGSRDPVVAAAAARPSRPRLSSPTFRVYLDAIERTEQEIGRSISQSIGPLNRLLTPVSNQARDLVAEGYMLADKGQVIESYLASINQRDMQARLRQIDQQINNTSDAYTRDQLQEARKAMEEKITHARDLETYISRIMAQLQNISANLDNVLAETVRLRTADAVSADAASSQVQQRLRDLKSDMDAFQAVLDTALTQAKPI
jgi:chromosome segregation ATPase